MTAQQTDKAVKRSVSFSPMTLAAAQKSANKTQGGNLSRYIQSLVERDLSGAAASIPEPGEDCLMELCEAFAPSYAHHMAQRVDGVDQRVMLETIVRLIALGEIGLRDVWTNAQWPKEAAGKGAGDAGK